MKKHNPGSESVSEQRQRELKRARRERRRAARAALVMRTLRPLAVRLGAAEQQVKQLEVQLKQAQDALAAQAPAPAQETSNA